jgi:hypothetical protein
MGHSLKKKCVDSRVNVNIFASTSVPSILTTVQVPNLALTHKKWITVRCSMQQPHHLTLNTKVGHKGIIPPHFPNGVEHPDAPATTPSDSKHKNL